MEECWYQGQNTQDAENDDVKLADFVSDSETFYLFSYQWEKINGKQTMNRTNQKSK